MGLGWAHIFFMLCHNDGDGRILTQGILIFILKKSNAWPAVPVHALSQLCDAQPVKVNRREG
jgi:hypothetical protein